MGVSTNLFHQDLLVVTSTCLGLPKGKYVKGIICSKNSKDLKNRKIEEPS